MTSSHDAVRCAQGTGRHSIAGPVLGAVSAVIVRTTAEEPL